MNCPDAFTALAKRQAFQCEQACERTALESRVTEEASALAALGDGKRARGHKRGCRTDERKRKRRKRTGVAVQRARREES